MVIQLCGAELRLLPGTGGTTARTTARRCPFVVYPSLRSALKMCTDSNGLRARCTNSDKCESGLKIDPRVRRSASDGVPPQINPKDFLFSSCFSSKIPQVR